MIRSGHFFLLLFSSFVSFAQTPVPHNGVPPSSAALIALKNAKIIVSPEKTIDNGVLLIENGRVKRVGSLVSIPKDAVAIDMDGKTIVPAFIETHSDVGIPEVKRETWSPRPQMERKEEGPYYWNESIQPEVSAASLYKKDAKKAKKLQEMGFGVAVTHRQDGLMRGTGTAILLGEHEAESDMIKSEVAAFFSFQKGVSRQSYPSSQMGAIALLRQAFYDAEYYEENKERIKTNLSLEALNKQLKLPLVFEVKDKLEALRVKKIAEEFSFHFIIVGKGNEYERLDKLKSWEDSRFILPLTFPDAYEVSDPFVARQIPLGDLKHWELAPSNPYFLTKNEIPISITAAGHKKTKDFWGHLHEAIERGLSKENALAALTTTPASWFGLNDFGSLEEGKYASFSVFTEDPFTFKESELIESWCVGNRQILVEKPAFDIRGNYNISLAGDVIYPIEITGTKDKPKAKITSISTKKDSAGVEEKDTLNPKVNLTLKDKDISIHFNVADDNYTGAITLHGKYNAKLGVIEGQGSLPNGKWIKWAAIKNKNPEKDDKNKPIQPDIYKENMVWYPNMAYGFDSLSLPTKKTYVIRNATLWTNEKEGIIKDASIILKDGKIDYIGKGDYVIPPDAVQINAEGLHVTSGIIDEHSHIAISKGVNESGQAVSAEASIADVVRSNDVNIYRQLSGGVTASQLLHGSANPIGGQSALIKLKWGAPPEEMLINDMPKFIKFALGENVKQSNWGNFQTERFPQTRMGVEQVFYDAFFRAKAYHEDWENYYETAKKRKTKDDVQKPARDLELEVVWEIMNSERFISCHSYVQSEINMLMHVADSMGFTVNTFTHILEGYKLADKMLAHGAGGSTFSDWWAYKFEVSDAIPYNAALMNEEGLVVAINSDDAEMGRRLNQEAAKAVKYGGSTEEDAWKMVTLNPAKLLHLDDRMGSLKVGKDADVVIWSDHPLSIMAKPVTVFIDGEIRYDFKTDERKRSLNQKERARIINAMLDANKAGKPARTFVKEDEKHWHCDTIGEEAAHDHEHNH